MKSLRKWQWIIVTVIIALMAAEMIGHFRTDEMIKVETKDGRVYWKTARDHSGTTGLMFSFLVLYTLVLKSQDRTADFLLELTDEIRNQKK